MTQTSHQDILSRFLFEEAPVRGTAVQLANTWQAVLSRHQYPAPLQTLLGEMLAAATLLSATLKFDGNLIMQIQGESALKLAVVEYATDLGLRATAKWEGDLSSMSLIDMLGDGQLVLTLDPRNGGTTYQGIVPLEGESLAQMLENYMQRSEQLETYIWLHADTDKVGGLLLQKMPSIGGVQQGVQDEDLWPRVVQLAKTVNPEELLLPTSTLLHRLFSEETIRLLGDVPQQFYCACSREKVGNMLTMLGKTEVDVTLAEQGSIEVRCDFCNTLYTFDEQDCHLLFDNSTPASQPTQH